MFEMLEREIAALPKVNIAELRAKWRRELKQAPQPHALSRTLTMILGPPEH